MNAMLILVLSAVLLSAATAEGSSGPSGPDAVPSGREEAPVYIDSTDILYLESFPVQVRLLVRGSLPTPCHEAAWDVQQDQERIAVRLWSLSDPSRVCVDVLEPFEVSIDLGSYESADVPVVLNGEEVGRVQVGAVPSPSAPADDRASLVGAGWSFGMCAGYCLADLAIDGERLILTGTDRQEQTTLFVNEGALTPAGRDTLDAALDALGDLTLEPVYGCPDCADGGAAYLVLSREGETSRHEMEFGNPPSELAELYEIAVSLIGGLERCESGGLVTVADGCVPWEG